MSDDPVLPAYDASGLTGVLGAVASQLAPSLAASKAQVGAVPAALWPQTGDSGSGSVVESGSGSVRGTPHIPSAKRYVVVLLDGLGWYALQAALADAPYLAGIFGDGHRLVTTAPSTTAAAITSLTTGAAPGEHGMVGYRFRWAPGSGMNALTWKDGPESVAEFLLAQTWFQRLSGAGVATSTVALGKFVDSGLTKVALAGARFVPEAPSTPARIEQAAEVAAAGERSLTYVYERKLDHVGHPHGTDSPRWHQALTKVDEFLERLRAALNSDTVLLVTGDHGMVDVGRQSRVVIEDETRLGTDLNQVEGEARFRHLYTERPRDVAARWQATLGSRAWVCRREEAAEQGWFGPILDVVRPRIGDVVVAMRDDWAVLTQTYPGEMRLIGMHGSLTPFEMYVPLLIDEGE